MSTALATQERAPRPALTNAGVVRAIVPQTFDEVFRMAQAIFASTLQPPSMKTVEQVMIGILFALEVGYTPMTGLSSIAVINGRPSLWGDGALGLVMDNDSYEDHEEIFEGLAGSDNFKAICIMQRKGKKPKRGEFSIKQAKAANLWAKPGPWQTYPDRMLQMRARAFAMRDAFPDVLRGLAIAEEQQDVPMRDVTPLAPPAPPLPTPAPILAVPQPANDQPAPLDEVAVPAFVPTPIVDVDIDDRPFASDNDDMPAPYDVPEPDPIEPPAPAPPPPPKAKPAKPERLASLESDFDFLHYLAKADEAFSKLKTPAEIEERWAKRAQPPRNLTNAELGVLIKMKGHHLERAAEASGKAATIIPPAPAATRPRQTAEDNATAAALESAIKRGRLAAAGGRPEIPPDDLVDNAALRAAWTNAYQSRLTQTPTP